jgi:hypothetical protein
MTDDSPGATADGDAESRGGAREVVVPTRVYKTVTVFSTLFAVAAVVLGFVLVDSATDRAQAPLSEVDPLVAILGLGLIVLAAVTYAFSTRFRAEGMGGTDDADDDTTDETDAA